MTLRTSVLPTAPPFLTIALDHLAEGEHADQLAVVHDDQRADVLARP